MNKLFFRAVLPFLFCIFSIFSAFSPRLEAAAPLPRATIVAEAAATPVPGDYACILSDDVFLYSEADERRGLFLLPKSYYVRLIEYRSDYCKVEYQRDESDAKRVVGYARTEDLTFVEYLPLRPYLYYTFEVKYRIEDTQTTDSSFLTEITVSCVYYGDYRVGSETYCYVLRGNEFGYIPKPVGLSFDENTEYADYLASLTPPEPERSDEPSESNQTSPVQIAILIAICLLVPVLAALIIKPPRRPPYETED